MNHAAGLIPLSTNAKSVVSLFQLKPKHVFFGTPLLCLGLWLGMMYGLPTWAAFGPPQAAFTVTMLFISSIVPLAVLDRSYGKNHWQNPNPDSEDDG
jgi:hypothetical protein